MAKRQRSGGDSLLSCQRGRTLLRWNTSGTWTRKIDYNSSSQVTDAYDARGVHTTFGYDDLNRVQTITYSDSTPTAHYYYDSQSLPSGAPSYTHINTTGRLLAMTYGSGTPITGNYFAYDVIGRVVTQKQVTGSTTYGLSYTYNYAGLLSGETYPSGRALSYSYDDGGRLSSVSDGTTTFANSFAYEAHGGLASETFGNTAVHALSYNRRLQASQVKLSMSSTVLQQYDYGYGEFNTSTGNVDTNKNNGQIGKVSGTIGATAQWNQGFGYDELGRLSNVTEHQGSTMTTQTYSQSYTYDVYGNRFQGANTTLGLPAVSSSEINAATNRFINSGSTPTTYDAAGNITADTKFRGLKYEYDANGRQSAVKHLDDTSVQSAVYDCAGQRVQTTEGSTIRTMVYDVFGQNVADYLGSSGSTLERENIYRGGQLLATNESLSAGAPSALAATPSSINVALSWSGSATKYRVERKSAGGSYDLLATPTSTSTTDSGASTGSAYLYRVCAADGANNCTSDYSNIALGARLNFTTDATIVSYSDDPSTATSIKAAHITELRTAINAVRSLAGQSSASWTHTTLTAQSSLIYADDVRDLRSALNDALVALSIQTSNYTDNTIVSYAENPLTATTVKAAHIRELRTRSTSGAGNSTSGGSSGGLHYVLTDLQGSTRAVMNNNGSSSAVIARHDYLPFGEEIGSSIGLRTSSQGYAASDTNRWKYGILQRDAATGLDHTWWRKYESFSARWTSPDPYGGSMQLVNPQSFNKYAYTQNDPIDFVDPTGLDCWATYLVFRQDGKIIKETLLSVQCTTGIIMPINVIFVDNGGGGSMGTVMKPATKQQIADYNAKNKAADDCMAKAKKEFHDNMDSIHITYTQGALNYLNAYRPHEEDLVGSSGGSLIEKVLGGAITARGLAAGAAASVGTRLIRLDQDLAHRILKAYQYQDLYAAAKSACSKLRP